MINLLKRAADFNLFNSLDIQFAIMLVEDENPLLLLIFALLSAETRAGHICLFIDKLQPIYLFNGRQPEIALILWETAGSPDSNKIYTELKQSNAVSDARQLLAKPLVLSNNKLYFQRMWTDEGLVANFFSSHLLETIDEERLKSILSYLFKTSSSRMYMKCWQKIAVAIAATSRISVISGGPGTGKTTIVARLLATLVKLSNKKLIIQLSAPTGKSAARLTESLNNALLKLNLSQTERSVIPEQAKTIHRLLCAKINSQSLRYNKDNKLLLDVLIIDEASMIDLTIMARLIEALPKHTRVILLGDKDQLASVESGSVLSDICSFSEYGYSSKRAAQLTKITGCDLSNFISDYGAEIKNSICLLQNSYRYDAQSGIGRLATAINKGNIKDVEHILVKQEADISFYSIDSPEKYEKLIYDISICYRSYFNKIKEGRNPQEILTTFNQFRLLAALREGLYGVVGLNNKLEELLHRNGHIRLSKFSLSKHYEGRPIMITKNNLSLGLFNGDIGIILLDRSENNGLMAYFQLPNGVVKKIQPSRLPQHETTFVMTVHKSQGSEFEHIALVLPPIFTSIVTKELIYTAITRAKDKLTIYANHYIFIKALMTPTLRRSGLTERLY
ncbi:MAG: exodeoxyribonuclease V subunit alpha [Arsenophonus sp.]